MSIQRELEGLPPEVIPLDEDQPEKFGDSTNRLYRRLTPPDPVQEVLEAQGDTFNDDEEEWGDPIPPLPDDDDDVAPSTEPARVMQNDAADPDLLENQQAAQEARDAEAQERLYGKPANDGSDLTSGLRRRSGVFRTSGNYWRN